MNKIPYEQRVGVYSKAMARFGEQVQMVMALEELSECQKEICKKLRGYSNLEHLSGRGDRRCHHHAGADEALLRAE